MDILKKLIKNKYLTLVPTKESKEKIGKYEGLWSKIRYLIRSVTINSDNYNDKHMTIKFNLTELPLNKTGEIPRMIIVVRVVFMNITNIIHKNFLINGYINDK